MDILSCTCSVTLSVLLQLCDPGMVYGPEAESHANQARPQRDKVRITITIQTIFAISLPVGKNHGMLVIDTAVDQSKDVTKKDGRKGHAAPILTEAVHAEGLSNKGWVDAEEEAIG